MASVFYVKDSALEVGTTHKLSSIQRVMSLGESWGRLISFDWTRFGREFEEVCFPMGS